MVRRAVTFSGHEGKSEGDPEPSQAGVCQGRAEAGQTQCGVHPGPHCTSVGRYATTHLLRQCLVAHAGPAIRFVDWHSRSFMAETPSLPFHCGVPDQGPPLVVLWYLRGGLVGLGKVAEW